MSCGVYVVIESLKTLLEQALGWRVSMNFYFCKPGGNILYPVLFFGRAPLRPRGHKYLSLSAFLQIASLASSFAL